MDQAFGFELCAQRRPYPAGWRDFLGTQLPARRADGGEILINQAASGASLHVAVSLGRKRAIGLLQDLFKLRTLHGGPFPTLFLIRATARLPSWRPGVVRGRGHARSPATC